MLRVSLAHTRDICELTERPDRWIRVRLAAKESSAERRAMEDWHLIVELGEVRIDKKLYDLDWWKGERAA